MFHCERELGPYEINWHILQLNSQLNNLCFVFFMHSCVFLTLNHWSFLSFNVYLSPENSVVILQFKRYVLILRCHQWLAGYDVRLKLIGHIVAFYLGFCLSHWETHCSAVFTDWHCKHISTPRDKGKNSSRTPPTPSSSSNSMSTGSDRRQVFLLRLSVRGTLWLG